jgi:hypothetical protein
VDDAEGAVWAEGIRARALVLAAELNGRWGERIANQCRPIGNSCGCTTCLAQRSIELLTEIAGTP